MHHADGWICGRSKRKSWLGRLWLQAEGCPVWSCVSSWVRWLEYLPCWLPDCNNTNCAESTGFSLLDPEECLTGQSAFSIPSSAKRSRTGDTDLGRHRQAAAAQWKPKPRVNAGAGQLQLIERLVLSFIRVLLQQSTPCDLENHDGFGAFHPILSLQFES